MCMSGNTRDMYNTNQGNDNSGSLMKAPDLLWIKLEERFKTMGQAYRYFDKDYDNSVSFSEFQKGLDYLRIKFQIHTVDKIYKYLDQENKGWVTYQDFCKLAEERRRNIDAFFNDPKMHSMRE